LLGALRLILVGKREVWQGGAAVQRAIISWRQRLRLGLLGKREVWQGGGAVQVRSLFLLLHLNPLFLAGKWAWLFEF
jgi:hypothetical protein